MKLVTAIDEAYLPGLVALANSVKANSPDTKLACMVYGSEQLMDVVDSLGVEVIANPEINSVLPTSELWPIASHAMYARILIPKLMKERTAWIDADCLVLKPIEDIVFSEPVAACKTSTTTLAQQIPGIKKDGHKAALFSGFMIFNTPEWNRLEITEKCLQAMHEDHNYLYAVQSVLSYVLGGNFYHLPDIWQVFANRSTTDKKAIKSAIMLHYVGVLPWLDQTKNRELWKHYESLSNWR